MLKHLQRHVVLAYHSVAERSYCNNVLRSASEHHLRFPAHLEYLARLGFQRHDRRLGKHNALAVYINKNRRRTEVYTYILSETKIKHLL